MRNHSITGIASFAVLIASLAGPSPLKASTNVESGWDLFITADTTSFDGANWQGVPLGTYNFGGTIGLKNVGATDTIVQRTTGANAPSGTVNLTIDALQMMTVSEVSFGGGPVGYHFLTLQSETPSTGTMNITFDPEPAGPPPTQPIHGTFSSTLDVFFDIRFGSLDGPVVMSSDIVLNTEGTSFWSHYPPEGAWLIEGVNYFLDGTDSLEDFFPVGPLSHVNNDDPTNPHHDVVVTTPEPQASLLVLLGMGLVGFFRRAIRCS